MLKTVLMVNEFYSYGGGASQYVVDLSKRLNNLGYQVGLLYGDRSEKLAKESELDLFCLPDAFGFNYTYGTEEEKRLTEILERINPDLIFVHQVLNPHVINLLARFKPTIRFEHGFRLSCVTGRRTHKRKRALCEYPPGLLCLLRAHTKRCSPRNPSLALKRYRDFQMNANAHRKLTHIIVASDYIKNLLLKSGYHPNQIAVLPYYTILPDLQIDAASPDVPTVVYVGRVEEEKGVHFLIKALSYVKVRLKVFIIGNGSRLARLKSDALHLTNRHEVIFTGWVKKEELTKYYSQATLAVVPSIWPEPFGIIGIEAMAHQLPVVAFDVGGISDWLKDGVNGYLAAARDYVGLAEKINDLIDQPDLAATMGRAGRDIAEKKFTVTAHLEELIPILDAAANTEP